MEIQERELVPCLPDHAPFTPEQRAYLNGFFAGLFSRAPVSSARPESAGAAPLTPLTILFGSQTGTAENLAKRTAKEAGKHGFAPTVYEMAKYPTAQLASEERLLIITSTYGDGEPPDNAKAFWKFLNAPAAGDRLSAGFSVCALGDSNYPQFCAFGRELDRRLEALGGQRLAPCAHCDVDFEQPFGKWLHESLTEFSAARPQSVAARTVETAATSDINLAPEKHFAKYSRANPCAAVLVTNRPLNAQGSSKDTRHFEFAFENSDLSYEAGDALGIFPENCYELVDEILGALHCAGTEIVPGRKAGPVSLREALRHHYEITRIPHPLLLAVAECADDPALKMLAAPNANGELSAFLHGREIIDLLTAHPTTTFGPAEFVALLKPLPPRLYSISSSPKAHAGRVHLTVNVVRYETLARRRQGVCSTFLAERVPPPREVPVFVQPNKNFRPPGDDDRPMIMVGPGTGIAPFRAFLHERKAKGATGRNWLLFGEQRAATDFLYRDELEAMQREKVLTRLDTAFSRDQAEKVYVQHRMREHAAELFAWLEAGAHFYVCGDASRMAKDVDAALHQVVREGGGRTAEQAAEYVDRLKQEKRYQRDVY